MIEYFFNVVQCNIIYGNKWNKWIEHKLLHLSNHPEALCLYYKIGLSPSSNVLLWFTSNTSSDYY